MEYRFCPVCGAGLSSRLLKPGEPERLVCGGCDFVFYLDPKVAAGTLVTVEGRLLLLRRAIEPRYGMWVFPGGFVDRGEHPEQPAIREAREEPGIEAVVRRAPASTTGSPPRFSPTDAAPGGHNPGRGNPGQAYW